MGIGRVVVLRDTDLIKQTCKRKNTWHHEIMKICIVVTWI